jgi:hypothetical protein
VRSSEILNILYKFRLVDKFQSFHEILPSVQFSTEEQKNFVSEILNSCCIELESLCRAVKPPSKVILKKTLVACMDELSIAPIDTDNREFGYQLGWYLADKVNVNLKKGTEKKVWGYWHIDGNEVKPPQKPRISAKVKKPKSSPRSEETVVAS